MPIFEEEFTQRVVEWYQKNGREFFWRQEDLNPFQVLVLEFLLKRTNAVTVDSYAKDFITTYDSLSKFLQADEETLKTEIDELGYYSRIDEINAVCKQIEDFGLPESREELLNITGIGVYTADAILCYGYGVATVPIDMNVARIGKVYFGIEIPSDLRYADELKEKMDSLVPEDNPEDFNWALQDLGARLRSDEDPLGLEG